MFRSCAPFILSMKGACSFDRCGAFVVMMFVAACNSGPDEHVRIRGKRVIENEYAKHFRILAEDDRRWLIVYGPGGTTDTLGVHAIGGDTAALPVLERIVVAGTTYLPYISSLGKADAVVGAAHMDDVRDTVMRDRYLKGLVKDVGTADGLDRELLITLAPQAIFDHPFGKDPNAGNDQGIPVIHFTEYLEEHPLGRAEWIRAFGVLLGEEMRADSLFQAIKDRYLAAAREVPEVERKPVIFFGSTWQGQWFAPPGNSYMATLIGDAGGAYAFADQVEEENISLDLEALLHKVRRCDRFGMILSAPAVDVITLSAGEERLARIRSVQEGGFYGNSATSDLFGNALLEPDVVLRDLRMIFHPLEGDSVPHVYFHPIADQSFTR